MKTIAVILVLSCLSLCFARSVDDGEPTQVWGDVSGDNIHLTEIKTLYEYCEPNAVQFRVIDFPTVTMKNLEIVGVKYFDHAAHPATVTLLQQTLPQPQVHFSVQSEVGHALNSTFVFYGRFSF